MGFGASLGSVSTMEAHHSALPSKKNSLFSCVFIFQGRHEEVPHTECFTQQRLIFSQLWRLKSRSPQGVLPLKVLGKDLLHASLLASASLQHSLACRCVTPTLCLTWCSPCVSVFTGPPASKDTSHIGLGAQSNTTLS